MVKIYLTEEEIRTDITKLFTSVDDLTNRVTLLELRYVPKTKVFGVYYDSKSTVPGAYRTLLGIYSTPEIANTKISVHSDFSKSAKDCYEIEEIMIDEF